MRIFCTLLTLLLLTSCDFPTHYFTSKVDCISSSAFPSDKNFVNVDYRSSVIEQLRNSKPGDFRYYFNSFQKEDNTVIMNVDFRNTKYCFNVDMIVERWDKLGGMYRTNGYAYPQELYDLRWKLEVRQGELIVVFEDMHTIID